MSDLKAQPPLSWADVEELILRALSIQSELNRLLQAQDKLRTEDVLQIKDALDLVNKEALQLLDLSRESWVFPASLPAEATSKDYHLWDLAQILRAANVDFLSVARAAVRNDPDVKETGLLDTKAICMLILRFSRYTHDCPNKFEDEVAETLPERIEREVERRIHQLRILPTGLETHHLQRQFDAKMENFVTGQRKMWAEERQKMKQMFEREMGSIQRASVKAQEMAEERWQAEMDGWLEEMKNTRRRLEGVKEGADLEESWEEAEMASLVDASTGHSGQGAQNEKSRPKSDIPTSSWAKACSPSSISPTFRWGQTFSRSSPPLANAPMSSSTSAAPGPTPTRRDVSSNPAVDVQTAIDILGRVAAALVSASQTKRR